MFRVYVDESGTRFISPKSDRYFVLSAVVIHDSKAPVVLAQLDTLRRYLGRGPGHVLHFSRLKPHRRPVAAGGVALMDIAAVIDVIICKNRVASYVSPTGNTAFIANPDPMYLWALRLLMERVSWYARDHGRQQAIVTFAHVRGFQPAKLHDYRAALESTPSISIETSVFGGHAFRVSSPKLLPLLQVADITASSCWHAVEPSADGDQYLRAHAGKLYCRFGKCAPTYGLVVFPKDEAQPGAPLHWLGSL